MGAGERDDIEFAKNGLRKVKANATVVKDEALSINTAKAWLLRGPSTPLPQKTWVKSASLMLDASRSGVKCSFVLRSENH
jgi:hypothetical protein